MAETETQVVGEKNVVGDPAHVVAVGHFQVYAPPLPPSSPRGEAKSVPELGPISQRQGLLWGFNSRSSLGQGEPALPKKDLESLCARREPLLISFYPSQSSCGSSSEEPYSCSQRALYSANNDTSASTGSEPPCVGQNVGDNNVQVRSSSSAAAAAIRKVPAPPISTFSSWCVAPFAVSIGPYHHGSPSLQEMEEAKKVARDEFCRAAGQLPAVIQQKMAALAADARGCYVDYRPDKYMDDDDCFAEIMLVDGCFLLQFMACMCPANRDDAPAADDVFWSKVHARVDAIGRDIMLLENQLPWPVLQALMDCTPGVSWPVAKFLELMASALDVENKVTMTDQLVRAANIDSQPPPPHLLGLFHRVQVGVERTHELHVPSLASLSSTAVDLTEMGIKIAASKARIFGDMTMTKRRHRLGLFGELSLAPVVLSNLTSCWLVNMMAYEVCLGTVCADNFVVSPYISVLALLLNREEDVQELRAKGVVVSMFSDVRTLSFFKGHAGHVRVGYRYHDVFKRLQEYKRERWVWIAVHGFLYRNARTIITVLSAVGVLVGLFKTIMSLKQPQRG